MLFLATKRILDERALLVERRDREPERDESSGSVYDVSSDGEDERREGLESSARENGSSGNAEAASSEGYVSDDDAYAPPAAVTGGG